jgi:hypothetical protein
MTGQGARAVFVVGSSTSDVVCQSSPLPSKSCKGKKKEKRKKFLSPLPL